MGECAGFLLASSPAWRRPSSIVRRWRATRSAALPRRSHGLEAQQSLTGFSGCAILAANASGDALDTQENAAEPALAGHRDCQLHLEAMAGMALEIRAAYQGPVHAGRGYFEPIGTLDRVGDIEHRRKRPRDRFAIIHRHGAVGTLGHDLDGAAVEPQNLHPNKAITQIHKDGLRDRSYSRCHALLDDQPRVGINLNHVARLRH
jgi:hypothetical protein